MKDKITILIGSHSIRKSASFYIAKKIDVLLKRYEKFEVNLVSVNKKPDFMEIEKIYESLILIIITPVYIDLPSSKLLSWMEAIKEQEEKCHSTRKLEYVYAVSNCGFYEAEHNDLVFDICKVFCKSIFAEYKYSIGIGCGQLITNIDQIKEYEEDVKVSFENGMERLVYQILNYSGKSKEDKYYITFQITSKEYEKLTCDYWIMLGKKNLLEEEEFYKQSYNFR